MYKRFKTYQVKIGNVALGGNNPVRIQSMTNTDTFDTDGSVNQVIRIVDAGADYVRLTAQTVKHAENLKHIKIKLAKNGCFSPLIADIHFSPKAAEVAAGIVEKVRINPGNYTDSKKFKNIDFTDAQYEEEIERIKDKFLPFLKLCKVNKTAIRLGANHGSLSDRIISRYGDTAEGMVESVMEFLRICFEQKFFNVVISMKASNPVVMIQATRLLVKTMKAENMQYPLHLGVTEAGSNDEGRIKSAVGTGTLLADGIGDTIRVSLTEEPEYEIPVAKEIVNTLKPEKLSNFKPLFDLKSNFNDLLEYNRRKTKAVSNIGGNNVPVIISDLSNYSIDTKGININADYIYTGKQIKIFDNKKNIVDFDNWKGRENTFPLFSPDEFLSATKKHEQINFVRVLSSDFLRDTVKKISNNKTVVFVVLLKDKNSKIHEGRYIFRYLLENNIETPVILKYEYPTFNSVMLIQSSAEAGALFIDGSGDGIWLKTNDNNAERLDEISFGILQACRLRITKTEYISCPSCGRTLFNLQKTTALIKEKTAHLKPVKIGIMGCIVNGPGEMADADFGYVGTSKGMVDLYKNKDVVKKNIPEENAVAELLKLIEANLV